MARLHNYHLKEGEDLSPEEESRFGTDPDFVSRYVPQDHKTQEHYRKLVGAGMAPHAAAMLATSSHTGKVDPTRLIESTNAIADIARRHTKPGPNGGSWETPHTPGSSPSRPVTYHRSDVVRVPQELTPPRPAPKSATPRRRAKKGTSRDNTKGEE